MNDAKQTPVGYWALVRHNANFRYLWFGQIISLLGDWFNLIASAALLALLTESGTAIGALFVVRMVAPFLISPIGGVLADRYNRKYILIATDISRAVTVLGFLWVRETEEVWLLYTLTAIQLGLSGLFFPSRSAILPDIVAGRELGAANMLSSVTWSVMLTLGAALGGLVSGIWGIYPAFTIDALTFLVSALILAQMKYEPTTDPASADKTLGQVLAEYVDGLRYLRDHRDIFFLALHKGAISLIVSGGFQVIYVTTAENLFVIGEGGSLSLGLMHTVVGVGTGVGPVAARYFTGDRQMRLRYAITVGYLIAAAGTLVIAPFSSFELFLFGTFWRGVGGGICWVLSTQLLLQLVPNQVRGRVFATEFALFTLMNAVGAATVGGLIDTPLGLPGIILGMAALLLLPGLLWTGWILRGNLARPS